MSGAITLEIVTGTDWAVQVDWKDPFGVGYPFSNPVMEIRQDLNVTSPRFARLDTTGTADGLITITVPGTMVLTLPAAITSNLTTGTARWDLFLTTGSNQRARLLFGDVAIKPRVTASA